MKTLGIVVSTAALGLAWSLVSCLESDISVLDTKQAEQYLAGQVIIHNSGLRSPKRLPIEQPIAFVRTLECIQQASCRDCTTISTVGGNAISLDCDKPNVRYGICLMTEANTECEMDKTTDCGSERHYTKEKCQGAATVLGPCMPRNC